ncbi:LOW QUALITY PROTEIN: cysteine--tRNA ligase, cytoplasmic-like [Scylla paramamosain]|uniref:LOW QUALITY PROTEIN: cysteine--tRNA ligase, cytoplasmic-like n=1 Tax=Scylla paramamosain TaxID=85552 RepID=UPI0030828CBD
MPKRPDPRWAAPEGVEVPRLHLYNSFTRRKELFVPQSQVITWYSCGPTVYDDSHMGHARSYVSFDILRRVLQDYFGFPIHYVMNITDIDDKIIKRARTRYLIQQYRKSQMQWDQVYEDLTRALEHHTQAIAATTDPDKRKMMLAEVEKVKNAADALKAATEGEAVEKQEELLKCAEGVLGEWLDQQKGKEVTDNSIFSELPRHYEEEFNKDMEALNVMEADVVTRVSEYVPQIVDYVAKIIENGYAYEANNSVYFDVAKFDAEPNHYYAKLVPEAYGNQAALEEGEGTLSAASAQEKRSPNDFALWKASKPGEPAWPSPWGPGRPGWHIECSAMASEIFGESIDIHTGGVDLKFPHHDNELAQAEAYFNNDHWVRYFLHTGHLHIDGCKMSKSLKNFITIKQALAENSPALLRISFLLHSWKDTLDYSSNTMEGSRQYYKMITEFSLNVQDLVRRAGLSSTQWAGPEVALQEAFNAARVGVHKALCDNIDTQDSLTASGDLLTESNKYMNSHSQVNSQLLVNINCYIWKLMKMFGVPHGDKSSSGGQGQEKVVGVAEVVGNIREQLRQWSRDKELEVGELRGRLLGLCDTIRDELLPPLGIRLEDREAGAPSIKVVDPGELMAEICAKKEQEEVRRQEKARKKAEQEAKQQQQKQEQAVPPINPKEMFHTSEYSQWDANGLPTHDAEGKEITKSQSKKLAKLMEAQRKKFEKWQQQQNS